MQRTKILYYLVMQFATGQSNKRSGNSTIFPNVLFIFRRYICPNIKTTSRQLPV